MRVDIKTLDGMREQVTKIESYIHNLPAISPETVEVLAAAELLEASLKRLAAKAQEADRGSGVQAAGEHWLDRQTFYELMQAYRTALPVDQVEVCVRFDAVKEYIRAHTERMNPAQDRGSGLQLSDDMLALLKEVQHLCEMAAPITDRAVSRLRELGKKAFPRGVADEAQRGSKVKVQCPGIAPRDGLPCALEFQHDPPCSDVGPFRNAGKNGRHVDVFDSKGENPVRSKIQSVILANLTEGEYSTFFASHIPYTGATGDGATRKTHGECAPYIATTYDVLPAAFAALGWESYWAEEQAGSLIVRRGDSRPGAGIPLNKVGSVTDWSAQVPDLRTGHMPSGFGHDYAYVANPVKVTAFRIIEAFPVPENLKALDRGNRFVRLEDGSVCEASAEMCARMKPKVGDYWVVQEDGYVYLNPKEIFERKYRPAGQPVVEKAAVERDAARADLERDRTKVAECLDAALKAMSSYSWLIEGRGCYSWNDDRWHEEFRKACESFRAALRPLVRIASDWTNCPQTTEEVRKARAGQPVQVSDLGLKVKS